MRLPTIREGRRTGRVRVIPGWFGRMVLEIEWTVTEYSACPPMPGRDPKQWRERMRAEGEQYPEWRKATWDDLNKLGPIAAAGVAPVEAPSLPDGGPFGRSSNHG